jgi:hypothetical protein
MFVLVIYRSMSCMEDVVDVLCKNILVNWETPAAEIARKIHDLNSILANVSCTFG